MSKVKRYVGFAYNNLGLVIGAIAIFLFVFRGLEPISSLTAVLLVAAIVLPMMAVMIIVTEEEEGSYVNPVLKRISRVDVLVGIMLILLYIGIASGLLTDM